MIGTWFPSWLDALPQIMNVIVVMQFLVKFSFTVALAYIFRCVSHGMCMCMRAAFGVARLGYR
jgi:hypothetical protein